MTQGFHVYTEKPPGLSYADVLRVLETERKTNKTCMTAFKKRFAPAYIKTKELVWSEEFGNPSALSIFRTSGPYKGGGEAYLLDSAIHVVDLADFLFGRVSSVTTLKSEPANYAVGLEFLGGGVGTLTLTDRLSYERGWEAVHAVGSGGVVVHVDNSVEMIAFQYGRPIAAHKPEFVAGTSNSLVEMGFVGELQAFVDAIRNATRPESSIENAARAMAVLDAVKKATASGRREKVDEV
jgi:virulence factor